MNSINIKKIDINYRKNKLDKSKKEKFSFPNNFKRNTTSDIINKKYKNKTKLELVKLNIEVYISGRIMIRRIIGKASFVIIQDMGGQIQLYITQNNISKNIYINNFKTWDLGDIIGAKGILFKTNTNELSIRCSEIYLLTKSIHPLPNKFHGLIDQENCYRQRYLDLIANKKSREIFKMRSHLITEIRNILRKNNFLEVETPIIQKIPGGATARPFVTYHNSLKKEMFLRISPELYLKQLVIGGFERVFEINKSFRNEGLSTRHNPEFTMMELYMAYANYNDLIFFLEKFLKKIIKKILKNTTITYNKHVCNFESKFKKITMLDSICSFYSKIELKDLEDIDNIKKIAEYMDIKIDKKWGLGRIQTEIFEKKVTNLLIQPTFITHYPTEVSPLARCIENNNFFSERFELFIFGKEIANGFSELNDSEEQAKRFSKQVELKEHGDDETMFYDQEYITALEYGLPPTAGLGLGIDRLMMLLTNSSSIRDVILFPILR